MKRRNFKGLIIIPILVMLIIIPGCTKSYYLSIEINPPDSGVIAPESGQYKEGQTIQLTADAEKDMIFDHWSGDVSGLDIYTSIIIDADKKVIANFVPLRTLSVEVLPAGAGSVTPSPGQYKDGDTVSLIANAVNGMVFDHWSGDISGSDAATRVLMNSNKKVIANFKALRTLSIEVSPAGAGLVTPSPGQYKDGETVSLVANPNEGYGFKYWSGDISDTSNNIYLVMDSNKQIIAVFQEVSPPEEVSNVFANPGWKKVGLSWQEPKDVDFAGIEITYEGLASPIIINKGITTIDITELVGNKQYTFTIRTVDNLGNKSAGVLVEATPLDHPDIWGKRFIFNGMVLFRWTGQSGYIDVCLDSVEVDSDGYMKFNITWKATVNIPGYTLWKESDVGNTNMYLTDEFNNRYDFVNIGGAAAAYITYTNNSRFPGWFTFPPAINNARTFFFHDGDLGVVSPPIILDDGIPLY